MVEMLGEVGGGRVWSDDISSPAGISSMMVTLNPFRSANRLYIRYNIPNDDDFMQ